ncbi:GAF domain-containing sensor histidine kinase [Jatrophihabitans sp. DSM 45814]
MATSLSHDELRVLGDEQVVLRQAATLVARGMPPEELFASVIADAGRLLAFDCATLGRYESDGTVSDATVSDGTVTIVASWNGAGGFAPAVGSQLTLGDAVGSGVGVPLLVDGRLWGVLAAYPSTGQQVPTGIDARLSNFAELMATAVANAESRAQLSRLADEQAALRRVATLVARGVRPEEVFAVVTEELGLLLGTYLAGMARFDSDDTVTVLATWPPEAERDGSHPLVPGPWPLDGGDIASEIFLTRRAVRIDDYRGVAGSIAAFVRDELGIGSSVGSPIVVEGRLWGALFVHAKQTDPRFPQATESRLTAFTELVATAIANAEGRAGLARLAEEQAALRRVTSLVARGVPPQDVFAAVIEEACRLLRLEFAGLGRYERGGAITLVAAWGRKGQHIPVGRRWNLGGNDVATLVFETGRAARIDTYTDTSGQLTDTGSQAGIGAGVGTPVIVEGRLWGVMATFAALGQPLPVNIEARLETFTELVATAIANADSRAELARLVDEQAALRRVATLVARAVPPEEVFAAVVGEVMRLLPVTFASLARFEADGTGTVMATSGHIENHFPVGSRWPLEGRNVVTSIYKTGHAARIDGYAEASGPLGVTAREQGFGSGVGTPVIVEGRVWGMIASYSDRDHLLPADTEERLASFTELVATAIANAESRAELMASRARIVAAADETRRRIERDLHDGIQQRLVSLGLELRMAQATVPPQLGELEGALSQVAQELGSVFDELREISHGIHPAILSEGGLHRALRALCRRSVLPVELDVHAERPLLEPVEVAAYYVVSEALSNAAKHAQASVVNVELNTEDAYLHLVIRDDGVGGADLSQGSGLIGLRDRIEALGGSLQVTSPVGVGTALLIEIPLDDASTAVSPKT